MRVVFSYTKTYFFKFCDFILLIYYSNKHITTKRYKFFYTARFLAPNLLILILHESETQHSLQAIRAASCHQINGPSHTVFPVNGTDSTPAVGVTVTGIQKRYWVYYEQEASHLAQAI